MRRGPVIAEIAAWTLFFPIAIVLMIRRKLGYGYETTEGRVDALLQWYPAPWRKRHGERFSELLRDAVADGRGDLRMRLDVAREGVIERKRAFRWESVWASLLLTVGWIMVVPQGIVAPILGLLRRAADLVRGALLRRRGAVARRRRDDRDRPAADRPRDPDLRPAARGDTARRRPPLRAPLRPHPARRRGADELGLGRARRATTPRIKNADASGVYHFPGFGAGRDRVPAGAHAGGV